MIEIENFDATIINLSKSFGVFKYSSLNPKIKTKLQPNKYYEIQWNFKSQTSLMNCCQMTWNLMQSWNVLRNQAESYALFKTIWNQ